MNVQDRRLLAVAVVSLCVSISIPKFLNWRYEQLEKDYWKEIKSPLTNNVDWYVDPLHGSDANDGLTQETAKKTWLWPKSIDLGGYSLTIHVDGEIPN